MSSTAFLKSSLALWHRREQFRQKRLDAASAAKSFKRVAKWKNLHEQAISVIRKRERQIAAKRPMRVRALDFARADLGEHEVGGNNVGPWVSMVIRANGGTPGESWCGDAVAYWYRKAGSRIVSRWWASTIQLAAKLAPVRNPVAGQVVVYTFGTGGPEHTGLFDVWIVRGKTFYAIEGNTQSHSTTSDNFGGHDGVCRQVRSVQRDGASFHRVAA